MDLTPLLPAMRRWAMQLSRGQMDIDDMVQDTLLAALAKKHQFQEGTNLKAWVFTIMRNRFLSSLRREQRRQRQIFEVDTMMSAPQPSRVEADDVLSTLATLAEQQQEALLLIALGHSYDEAAELTGAAVGTIKSRVSRARSTLEQRLN